LVGDAGDRYTLVVGPDSPDRAWLEAVLMRGGLQVAACSEPELLAMLDIVPPQLVVLDDSSSYDQRMASFARLRAHPCLAEVPLVVLARDTDIDSFSDVIARGASAYLVKPVAAEELVAVASRISDWLSSSGRSDRRRRSRRPLVMRVDVAAAGRAPVAGRILDVGQGGCCIELPAPVARGETVKLTLHGVEGSTDLTLSAEVRWRRAARDGTEVAGLRFTGTTAVLAGRLLGVVGGAS
jgi:CheY-like chemotaxis protein